MIKKLILIPVLMLSCAKEVSADQTALTTQSAVTATAAEPAKAEDSAEIRDSVINNAPATKEVLRTGVMRNLEGKRIIREADASQLPFSLGEEITEDGQQLVLKLKNVTDKPLKITVKPENPSMNIRINQIRDTKGNFDGPFSQTTEHATGGSGEIWIIIGKSNMASGTAAGRFTVSIE